MKNTLYFPSKGESRDTIIIKEHILYITLGQSEATIYLKDGCSFMIEYPDKDEMLNYLRKQLK